MKIQFHCGHCHTELSVPASAVGQESRCPTCKTVSTIPPAAPSGRERSYDCEHCGRRFSAVPTDEPAECPRCGVRQEDDEGGSPPGEDAIAFSRRTLWFTFGGLAATAVVAILLAGPVPWVRSLGFVLPAAMAVASLALLRVSFGMEQRIAERRPTGTRPLYRPDDGFLERASKFTARYPHAALGFLLSIVTLIGLHVRGPSATAPAAPLVADANSIPRQPATGPFAPPAPKSSAPGALLPYSPPGLPPDLTEWPGLVSYWRFDEGGGAVSADAKSRAAGTLYGGRWVPGVRGAAVEFDGARDWFDFGNTARLNVASNAPVTISCWVKPTSRNGPVFTFRGQEPNITSTLLGVWFEEGRLSTMVRKDGSLMYPNELFGPGEVVPNVWHHVALTRHADGTVELYQDGALASRRKTGESNGSLTTVTRALGWEQHPRLKPGWTEPPQNKHLAGAIDEFAMFDRVLSAAEIAKLAGR